MIVVPYKAHHLERLCIQEAQAYLSPYLTPEMAKALELGVAFTALEGDRVLACSGVVDMWDNRCVAWAYLDQRPGHHFVSVHRAVARFLEGYPCRRIEATVDAGFDDGHRWIKKLGFKLETPEPMQAYTPDGRAAYLYSRVK